MNTTDNYDIAVLAMEINNTFANLEKELETLWNAGYEEKHRVYKMQEEFSKILESLDVRVKMEMAS